MPKKAPELTALAVKRLTDPGLHAVGGVDGLALQVKDTGARSWIMRVQVGERREHLGLGGFPDVTLEQARARAREVREQLRQGIDPLAARRAVKAALRAAAPKMLTFDQAAKQCHAKKAPEFRSTKHRADWINSLTTHASPHIGTVPIDAVQVSHVLEALRPIWNSKTETATRVRQRIEDVLDWATVTGLRAGPNPAAWDGNLEHVLARPSRVRKVEHHAAIQWAEVPAFMVELRKREGMGARALEFAILTAARSGEVRLATWDEIDTEAKLWAVPAARMKAGKSHRVPLSEPVLALLKALPRMVDSPYVFPAVRGGPLSDMSLSAVTRRMGVDAVPHGFRSSFKDWARSSTAYPDEVSELALAHVNSDATRAAYARDELLPKRKALMAAWAKYLATVPKKADVVPMGGAGMTIKRELREVREQLKAMEAECESRRFQVAWLKILKLAAESGDVELIEDIGWLLRKTKYYTDRHATSNQAQDRARRAKAKIIDADYDRQAPVAKSKKDLAKRLGVHPTTLSRYEKARFGRIS